MDRDRRWWPPRAGRGWRCGHPRWRRRPRPRGRRRPGSPRSRRAAPDRAGRRAGSAAIVGQPVGEHLVGGLLGLGHVGLVEGVDAEHGAAHRGGELPQQHLGADRGGTVVGQGTRPDGPRSARTSSPWCSPMPTNRRSSPYTSGGPSRSPAMGTTPVPVLAGRLGQQLLQPQAEGLDLGVDDERHLVPPGLDRSAEDGAEAKARVGTRVHVGNQLPGLAGRVLQHRQISRPRPGRRGPCRSRTAPSSGRRCRGGSPTPCGSCAPRPAPAGRSPGR